MIEISNLRKESKKGYSCIIADITSDIEREDKESCIYIGVLPENEDMLAVDVYDAFLFIPLYMAMYYHTDLRIHGSVSKSLYRNLVDYVQPILCSFSNKLQKVNVIVDGYKEAEGPHDVVGTGLSCGVDCLSTVYKYFVEEKDPQYKINALFMLNCGWHGEYGKEETIKIFNERYLENKKAADDMGLPLIAVDSNLHAFLWNLDDLASYFALYSCVFALQRRMRRYYISSSFSYGQVMDYGKFARNRDFSEYGDPLVLPLLHSANCELVSDGCQYTRSEKLSHFVDWDISKKYLNVCCKNDAKENCSICHKCVRTIFPLEAMGKLEDYSGVFDIAKYRKIAYKEKCCLVIAGSKCKKTNAFVIDNYEFSKKLGMKLPSVLMARIKYLPNSIRNIIHRVF